MRILGKALTVFGLWASAAGALTAAPPTFSECRLEHPLHLGSQAARCAVIAVPLDRADPHGPTIDLTVALVAALNRRSTEAPLFLLAGGPGQSAIDLYASVAPALARINRNHDIVMLDQRGTGRSSALRCAYPDDWNETAAELPQIRQATADCLAKLGPGVRNYTSSVAVRDLDEVRRALGYGLIDLYGASYGTRMVELYMRRYPQSVHAVILDGVTDPVRPIGPDTPLDAERALLLIVARCEETRDCAAAYPDLPRELASLRARFGPGRLSLTLDDPSSGLPQSLEFDRSLLNASLRFMSYSGAQAALLPTLIHEAAAGRLAPLAAQALMMAGQISDQLASGMQNSVVCSEDVPFFSREDLDPARVADTYQGSDQLDALRAICALWPRGPVDADLHAPLQSDIPSLLLSGEADPVTPPATAEAAARLLTRHRHLVLAGEGHGQLATGCVPQLMAAFLDADQPERIDAACLARHVPPPFFVRPSGPSP
ncbi:MAG TPA: alpha/beta fold hydrolase [Steroidobacteraceae bacterium]|nr:alpha/beta fold hydrolase [Steroidobacteraceae bacterium]